MNKGTFPGGWSLDFGPLYIEWEKDSDTIFELAWEKGWLFWVSVCHYALRFDPLWWRR